MVEKEMNKKRGLTSLNMKIILLLLQIMLPFGMYFALMNGQTLPLAIVSGVLFISMIVLVSLG